MRLGIYLKSRPEAQRQVFVVAVAFLAHSIICFGGTSNLRPIQLNSEPKSIIICRPSWRAANRLLRSRQMISHCKFLQPLSSARESPFKWTLTTCENVAPPALIIILVLRLASCPFLSLECPLHSKAAHSGARFVWLSKSAIRPNLECDCGQVAGLDLRLCSSCEIPIRQVPLHSQEVTQPPAWRLSETRARELPTRRNESI